MQPDTCGCCVKARKPLGKQADDETRKDITRSCRRKPGWCRVIYDDAPLGIGHHCIGPLEDDSCTRAGCSGAHPNQSRHVSPQIGEDPAELPLMRGQYGRPTRMCPAADCLPKPIRCRRETCQGIGIQNNPARTIQGHKRMSQGPLTHTISRADEDCIETAVGKHASKIDSLCNAADHDRRKVGSMDQQS